MIEPFDDTAPTSDVLTDYDRTHLRLYMRLLDAIAASADWVEVVAVLFGLDAILEPDRARHVYVSHLARAQWVSQAGYRALLKDGPSHD